MKNRLTALLLIISVIIIGTFSSCKNLTSNSSSETIIIDEVSSKVETSIEESSSKTESQKPKEESSIPKTSSTESVISTPEKAEPKPSVQVSVEVKVEETIVTDKEIKEPETNETIDEIIINNKQNSINESDYYQYSSSTEKEKKLYRSVVDTIYQGKNIVDVSKQSASYDEVVNVFQKVLADYPQFFYISRYCMLAYGSKSEYVNALILLYTDGETTDVFDQSLNLTTSANRTIINEKIATLQSCVETIIEKIPTNLSEVLKEKMIHDYVVNNISYDYEAAKNIENYEMTVPHSFDIYGALIWKKSVCEGYSKLFQYLCYNIGINATQVIGTSNGGNHMWNAVKIDGEWYQIDATWNDTENIPSYSYFNLATEKISKNHSIDSSVLAVPSCQSDKNSFNSVFALYVQNLNELPYNYENVLSNLKATNDKYIYIYFEGIENSINTKKYTMYIQNTLLSKTSKFNAYIKNKGISLSSTITMISEYYILTIN